ncbi:uncharacterized protein LOC120336097 [Styela clava]
MADDISDKRRRSKKKRSSLLTWKKKFNIKKRFTNKLPLHRRYIRALMSGWSMSDVRSMLTQYEITSMLKQLSIMADKSRPSCPTVSQDLGELFRKLSCTDMKIICCQLSEEDCRSHHHKPSDHKVYQAHKALLLSRWPYFRNIMKNQISHQNRRSYEESLLRSTDVNYESSLSENNEKTMDICMQKVCIYGMTYDKITEILGEIYEGKKCGIMQSNPRKLLPLPTTDDSFHLRNSRGKQTLRPTLMECEQPIIPRRNVVRRKHKQRFSMDERILSNQNIASGATSGQQTKSCKFTPSDVMQSASSNQYVTAFNQSAVEQRTYGNRIDKDVPHIIYDDLAKMYSDAESGLGDTKIIFSSDLSSGFTSWMTPHPRRRDINNHYQAWISHYESPSFYHYSSREWQDPLYCHRAILSARSTYFRRLIEKQMSSASWWETSSSSVFTLEIDGNVIPPKYMGAVLYTMYTDKIDLQRIYDRAGQRGMPMGGSSNQFFLRDALMLHLIGRFIEFPQLVFGCEEFIVDNLDQNNLLQVLHWTSSPNGSEWVKRQVYNFIRERFSELLSSGVLFELDLLHITEVLSSDFVNSSELDILKCALRWGEHELLRRIEQREPNLLTHTAHSVSRSKSASARRRELISARIEELHECTAPVLACVRMQHLLPLNHELFTNAVKRGVISRPPADLLEHINDREGCARQWIKSSVDFVPPRLFQPYMDETKNILDERFAQDSDCVSLRSVHNFPRDQTWCSVRHQMELTTHGIPDALYMVGQARLPSRRRYGNRDLLLNFPPKHENLPQHTSEPTKYIGKYYPVPDKDILKELFARERELRSTYIVNKVLRACIDCCHGNSKLFGGSIGKTLGRSDLTSEDVVDSDDTEYCNRCSAIRLVRLYVVRERDLADCAIDVLQQPELYYTFNELRSAIISDAPVMNPLRQGRLTRPLTRVENLFPSRQINTNDSINNGRRCFTENQLLDLESTELQLSDPQATSSKSKSRKGFASRTEGVNVVRTHHSDKILNRSFPSPSVDPNILNLQQNLESNSELSSSSSDEGNVIRMRRKRRSLSRKGSSSTTSYHSIPDVAASANSSLQRLRNSVKSRQDGPRNSPLVTTSQNFTPTVPSLPPNDYFAKLTETETCDSSTSSCEENTSENDDFAHGAKHQIVSDLTENEFLGLTSSMLPNTSGTDFSMNVYPTSMQLRSELPPDVPPRSSTKIRPPRRRPLSIGMSELFNSSLSFIDDNMESSEDNLINSDVTIVPNNNQSACGQLQQSEMPELLKDGTLPRQNGISSFEKPDIYPSETDCNIEEQCGQYFFCSLTREKLSKTRSNGEQATTSRSGTSFSFALSEQKKQNSHVKINESSESSNLNENENILFI